MLKLTLSSLALVFTIIALPRAVFAQDVALVFEALDTNDDGLVSLEEARVNDFVTESFDDADTNGDLVISREEFFAAYGPE